MKRSKFGIDRLMPSCAYEPQGMVLADAGLDYQGQQSAVWDQQILRTQL